MEQPQERTEEEKIPLGQVIFDEWFLLFVLSMIISFMIFNVWDLLELLSLTPMP